MTFKLQIPTPDSSLDISIEPGSSIIFVGANGGGKTRLSVYIEESQNENAHRISAHRALVLNPSVAKISEQQAKAGLRFGHQGQVNVGHRSAHRWQGKSAISLLNDFDYLIQVLFADQSNISLKTHQKNRSGNHDLADPTTFEKLQGIWERLLPNRHLKISGDDIVVSVDKITDSFPASEMSDGERSVFYLIGQTLVAEDKSLLIFDEPELHIHRSIMGKLWDELEAARPDCGFVFITHDLEFAALREAQKFVIISFEPTPIWQIEEVPKDTGFSEEITTLILGSRQPILFVEGSETSLDIAIYRCCFPNLTVIPKGSCEEVIHSVVTMKGNKDLTRVSCAGLIDADDHHAEDIDKLSRMGVAVLPVSEIENLVLLPEISREIAKSNGYRNAELEDVLNTLKKVVFDKLKNAGEIDLIVSRYCKRRIDRALKKINLDTARTVDEIVEKYNRETANLDINAISKQIRGRIEKAIGNEDLPALLANCDNKEFINMAARHLKSNGLTDFKQWLSRTLLNDEAPELTAAFRDALPNID